MVARQHYRWDFIGLSTDQKPTPATSEKVVDGSTFYCSNNSKLYVWYKDQWYEKTVSGGGGGTSDFDQLTNRPKYNDIAMTSETNIPEVITYTAGSNITISDGEISATDTTYSNFTGTDGTTAGTSGLVPAPATTDAGKFLKADGTWDTAGGGSGPTVVQTTGTSTTDVMSQNATTSMVFADPATQQKIKIGAGASTSEGINAIEIGYNSVATAPNGIALGSGTAAASINGATVIGANSQATGEGSISIGGGWQGAYAGGTGAINIGGGGSARSATGNGAISLGIYAPANSVQGKIEVGSTNTSYGYNSSNYRLLSGLYDGQSAHDAITKGQLDSIAIQNAGAPTTSTVGTVGQLLEDTTNGKLYQCTAVDTTDPQNPSYTWSEVGAGGGGGPTVVQTTGTSTTDVMSQNATTSMVFADPATQYKIKIGAGTSTSEGDDGIEIGHNAKATALNTTALGLSASASGSRATAIGQASNAVADNSLAVGGATVRSTSNYGVAIGYAAEVGSNKPGAIALGAYSYPSATGEMNIGSSNTSYGYNNSNYRLLSGLYDPQSAHDAATKGYVDPTTDSSAPTTATVGRLGQIFIDTTAGDAYMCVVADTVTPAYTWKKITP